VAQSSEAFLFYIQKVRHPLISGFIGLSEAKNGEEEKRRRG
jgi:hypothetical protein